ncbi:methyltransferase domain-containing protein [Halarcobacter sp.]|uniref:methyltransferase domain-containing protein n=1 Tax=Halarcobacter sp. TaxID=2321133 RepID=UPI0029F49C85|nr:methyltransferase domain-containing protein [Halarcobacter sp.]
MNSHAVKEAFEKAMQLQKSGSTTQAITIYEDILFEDKTNFEANFEIGNCHKTNKNYNKALFYLKEASKANTECYTCHFNMAQIYDKLCKYEFSLFHLEKVMKVCPEFYEALFSIAQCYRKMKNEGKMYEYLKRTLAKLPEHPGANHLLASLNEETSSEYSSLYARDLFDRYAGHFEEHLVSSLKYQVPFIIKEKLFSLNSSKDSKILDLGCGTGLLGKTIVESFPNLVGVDISSNMIDETRKKDIYSELHTNDIHKFLLESVKEYDLIIAADVFIYIGALKTIFSSIKKTINSDSHFIFTIELLDELEKESFQLGKSGRFSHTIKYIESLCKDFGFELIDKEEIILREENKIGQKGAIFILKTCDI